MPSVPSNVTPAMLVWARKTEGLTVELVSEAEKIPLQRLVDWESGKGTPSLAALERLAKRYHRPPHVFYLSEPPKAFTVVRDFRVRPDVVHRGSYSLSLRLAIRRAQERQAWASTYFEDEGYPRSELAGSYSVDGDPENTGKELRNILGATIDSQSRRLSPSDAFVYWRRLVEGCGVFVFQASRVEVEEMRGLSLTDTYAPAVVINSREAFLPKVFTLIHELAHILIGQTSVSGAGLSAFSPRPRSKVERFCNRLATEVLVPKADFMLRVPLDWMKRDEEVLTNLSRFYWVSKSVIALRLTETGFASNKYAQQKLGRFRRKDVKPAPVVIPQARLAIGRVGESFSRTVIAAYREGNIHGGQLSTLLSMRLRHLPQLEQFVLPGQVNSIIKNAS